VLFFLGELQPGSACFKLTYPHFWSQPISGLYNCRQRTGLGVVGGFENRPPGTKAQLKKLKINFLVHSNPARTEDAMLLKMKLQRHAPITPNPILCLQFTKFSKGTWIKIFERTKGGVRL
jgi:hypothetical protein